MGMHAQIQDPDVFIECIILLQLLIIFPHRLKGKSVAFPLPQHFKKIIIGDTVVGPYLYKIKCRSLTIIFFQDRAMIKLERAGKGIYKKTYCQDQYVADVGHEGSASMVSSGTKIWFHTGSMGWPDWYTSSAVTVSSRASYRHS